MIDLGFSVCRNAFVDVNPKFHRNIFFGYKHKHRENKILKSSLDECMVDCLSYLGFGRNYHQVLYHNQTNIMTHNRKHGCI